MRTPSMTASVPAATTPGEARARGVRFLLENQNDDGSFGRFASARPGEIYLGTQASHDGFLVATSALSVLALRGERERPEVPAAYERGLRFLLEAAPAMRVQGDTYYDTWAHVYLVETLAVVSQDELDASTRAALERVVRREVGILADLQAGDGGFGYYDFGYGLAVPSGWESTSFLTAAAALALVRARERGFAVDAYRLDRALDCIERLRLPSGAYVYGNYARLRPGVYFNRVNGSLTRSQACNLALFTCGRGVSTEAVAKGLDDLRENHHFLDIGLLRPYPHEAWYYTSGYYVLFGYYYAARAVEVLGDRAPSGARPFLVETLLRLQQPSGAWADYPLYGYGDDYGTAYALLALQRLR